MIKIIVKCTLTLLLSAIVIAMLLGMYATSGTIVNGTSVISLNSIVNKDPIFTYSQYYKKAALLTISNSSGFLVVQDKTYNVHMLDSQYVGTMTVTKVGPSAVQYKGVIARSLVGKVLFGFLTLVVLAFSAFLFRAIWYGDW